MKVNLKCKLDLWLFNLSAEVKFDYLWQDITIFEFGSKNSTRYKPGLMSYSAVTASDEDAIYYKNEEGGLIREVNGSRSLLYSDEFFSICGIDASYIYVLKPDEGNSYKIYRISKKDGIDKKIADRVKMCLTIDEDNIYYTSSFDDKTILKLDRSKLEEETYILMPQSVRFMEKQGDNFYVVAQNESRFFLFSEPAYCYIVGKDFGETRILKEMGDNPDIKDYYTEEYDEYTYAARMLSDGNLRSTASQVCWVSKDGSSSVVTDCISGWNPCDEGIFTTLENDSEGLPYKIVLYRASDGSQVKVLESSSDQAFFTLCKATNNSWYYIDQTEEALILYVTDAGFGSKREIKRFSLQDISYDLHKCDMTIMNNRCYFYTMPDDFTCQVIYRYDIY